MREETRAKRTMRAKRNTEAGMTVLSVCVDNSIVERMDEILRRQEVDTTRSSIHRYLILKGLSAVDREEAARG
jgi:hypothetical protein